MRQYRLLVVVIMVAAVGVVSGCRSLFSPLMKHNRPDQEFSLNPNDASQAEAMAYFSMGSLLESMLDAGALTNYLQAAELEPECEILYVHIARQYIKQGKDDQAVAIMEKACRQNPKSFDAHLYLAKVCMALNQLDKSEDACIRAMALAPQNPNGHLYLASIYEKKQDADHTLSTLEDALSKVNDKLPILRALGDLYAKRISITKDETSALYLKQAINYYEQASREPHDAFSIPYLHRLADLYILNKNIKEAIQGLNDLAIHQPDDIQVQKKLVLCYLAVNDKENAIQLLKTIRLREPDNSEVNYYLGELYEAMGSITNAVNSYTSACETTLSNPLPYIKLALLYLKTDTEKASKTLKAGLKKVPENTKMLEILARLYLINRQNKEAFNIFEQIQEIISKKDNSSLTSHFFLTFGKAAQQSQLPEKTVSLYKQAIELDPTSFESYRLLAFFYLKENRNKDAIQLMEKAAIALPDNPYVYYYLGLFNNEAHHFKESVKAFNKVEEIAVHYPEPILNSVFFFNYGTACERYGQFEQAENLIQKSILLDPENQCALNYLAYMWAEKGVNLDMALEYVTHALDLDPESAAYIDTLGWIYFKQKKYNIALEHIQSALYFLPDDPTIAEHLGDTLWALHQKKKAIAWWIYSHQIQPGNPVLEKKLKQQGINVEKLHQNHIPANESSVSP